MKIKSTLVIISLVLVVSLLITGCNITEDIDIETKAKEKVNSLISAFENEDATAMNNILAPDFKWYLDGNEITSNKEDYINMMKTNFEEGATIENIDYKDLTINAENDSYVIISGHWVEEGTNPDGSSANYDNNNRFHIKKINGEWLITKLETTSNE